jgi:hypothetical protein
MGRATNLITSFVAGELSPRLDPRTDIKQYSQGAREIQNGIVLVHGGVTKRPGTMHVLPCYDTTFASRLERFEYSTAQAYIIEFAPGYLRFFKDQAVITGTAKNITAATKANPCVITSAAHGFANGDQVLITGVGGMTELNNRVFTVANVATNTFALSGVNSSAYTTYTSGGTAAPPIRLAHTYTNTEIDELWVTQSADTMYIFHQAHGLAKLTRSSHTSWTLTAASISNGPFRTLNTDTAHYLTVAVTGSATITAATKAKPVVITTSAAHDFLEGCSVRIASVSGMTQLNGNTYVARNVTSTTFELWTYFGTQLDGTAFGTYTSGGTATIAVTQFGTISPGSKVTLTSTKSLFNSSHVGSLFRLWEPGQVTGIGAPGDISVGVGEADSYTWDGKVYGFANATATTWQTEWHYPSHESGIVHVRDSGNTNYFESVFLHDSSCVLQILTYSSATSVTARVVRNHIPRSVRDAPGTSFWEEGAWSAVRGYPRVGTFHKSRLFGISSTSDPQFLWSSIVRSFENFQDGADDDRGIVDQMLSDRVEIARWVAAMPKALLIGTAGSVQAIYGSTTGDSRGLTPTNVEIREQLPLGVSAMRPIRIGEVLFYGERNGSTSNPARVINEARYDYNSDAFVAPSATIISEHITGTGVEEGCYQATPVSVMWVRRTDGVLIGLTYDPAQDVRGWHRHLLGGSTDDSDFGECKRIAVMPGGDGDEPWMVTRRKINGSHVHNIEFMTTGLLPTNDKEDCVYLDSALTYDGTSTSSITGLNHLEGATVYALVDGSKQGPFTVAAGKITLTSAGSLVHVGLQYLSVVETVDIDAAAQMGTAKTRAKLISTAWPFFYRSLGGRIGPDADNMYDILFRTDSDLLGTSPELKTDFIEHDMAGGWDRRGIIRFEHDEPYPFTFLGVASEVSTSG